MSFTSPLTPAPDAATRITPLRTVTPRRSLPGPRAITGGVLVAVAAIAAYVAASGATGDHRTPVAVAARDIPAGTLLSPADFSVVRMQLSPALASHVSHTASRFVGYTSLGPVKQGEIIQSGDVEPTGIEGAQPEISVSIPAARALGGALRSGDRVDVIETDKSSSGTTHTAVSNAQVVAVSQASSSVGSTGDETVTFAVSSRDDATAIAAANDKGQITLVRTTGLSGGGNDSTATPTTTTIAPQ